MVVFCIDIASRLTAADVVFVYMTATYNYLMHKKSPSYDELFLTESARIRICILDLHQDRSQKFQLQL